MRKFALLFVFATAATASLLAVDSPDHTPHLVEVEVLFARTLHGDDMALVDNGIFKINQSLTNPEVEAFLHALHNNVDTELLSAPKVVITNSQEAIFKLVTKYTYPTEYELEDGQSCDNNDRVQNHRLALRPSAFEVCESGVILRVVPEVPEDARMIILRLAQQIISEPEWVDQVAEYPKDGFNSKGEMDVCRIAMKQPVFKVRDYNTKVAIYNGATVLMGYLARKNSSKVEDKHSFLGDIPIIGRLFRATCEPSKKSELVIFVTARLVDPSAGH